MGCLIAAIGFLLLIGCSFFGAAVVFNVMHMFDSTAPVLWGDIVSSSVCFTLSLVLGVGLTAVGLGTLDRKS